MFAHIYSASVILTRDLSRAVYCYLYRTLALTSDNLRRNATSIPFAQTNDFGHDSGAAWEANFTNTYIAFVRNATTRYGKPGMPVFLAQVRE